MGVFEQWGQLFQPLGPGVHGFGAKAKDFSFGDLNNDGRVDIVAVKPDHNKDTEGGNRIYFNQIANGNHYIKVNATTESNRLGIGAKVTVYERGSNKILGYDEVRTDFCYRSKKSTTLHFGLGKIKKVDVKLVLRSGRSVVYRDLLADKEHTLSVPVGSEIE